MPGGRRGGELVGARLDPSDGLRDPGCTRDLGQERGAAIPRPAHEMRLAGEEERAVGAVHGMERVQPELEGGLVDAPLEAVEDEPPGGMGVSRGLVRRVIEPADVPGVRAR